MAFLSRRSRSAAAAAIALAIVFGASRPSAQTTEAGEQVIKAAFLYNFTKFIEWPELAFADPTAPFAVCVFGDASFHGHVTAAMEGEQVRGRPVVVVRRPSPDDLAGCHMVYFSRMDADYAGKSLTALRELPILTVGEGQRFMQMGGHIAFHLEHDRVRFSVSRTRAEAARLNISSKLLRVAKAVE